MTNVNIETRTWYGRKPDPDDRWDTGEREGEVVGIRVNDDYVDYNGIETDLNPPFYVVYAQYYDGSTFGRDFYANVLGAFENFEDAEEFARNTLSVTDHSVPWNGYFAKLISIEVEHVRPRLTLHP